MTEPNPEHEHERDFDSGDEHDELPDPSLIPRWVPVLIGVILASLAGLAVYTGLRYRDDGTLTGQIHPQRTRTATAAPPGEPGAGASLMVPGTGGENTPAAGEPVKGEARAVITGGPSGVEGLRRYWVRRGMVVTMKPADAVVYVNDLPIGQVRQFDTADEVYDFAEPGSYIVRIVAPDGTERKCVVTATDDARQNIVTLGDTLK